MTRLKAAHPTDGPVYLRQRRWRPSQGRHFDQSPPASQLKSLGEPTPDCTNGNPGLVSDTIRFCEAEAIAADGVSVAAHPLRAVPTVRTANAAISCLSMVGVPWTEHPAPHGQGVDLTGKDRVSVAVILAAQRRICDQGHNRPSGWTKTGGMSPITTSKEEIQCPSK